MNNNEEKLFTSGEFAKKAGVTIRTIRYYDKIGLLTPSAYNDKGYRLYTKNDFGRLQKILTLKFIGLSLEDIDKIIKYDINDKDFKRSLEIQKQIIEEKINHMIMVRDAVEDTVEMVKSNNSVNWDKFVNIINVINKEGKWIEQYQNASNLRARISIHENFSVNTYGWMRWYYDQIEIKEGSKVLELGCGDGTLWKKNIDRLPKDVEITLTDYSKGMLRDTKYNLGEKSNIFKFKRVDAVDIPFEDESFDVIIANHMLYHVSDVDKALSEIKRVLKRGGNFYASTVGEIHMCEMRQFIYKVNPKLLELESFHATEKFQLENGELILRALFDSVELKKYEDSLFLTEVYPLIEYIFSMPGNIKEALDKNSLLRLTSLLNIEIKEQGGIHITKDTGFFHATRKE